MKEIRVSVPLTEINLYFRNMRDLLGIHAELVSLLETETTLKSITALISMSVSALTSLSKRPPLSSKRSVRTSPRQ